MTREEVIHELKMCKAIIEQDGKDYLDERDIPLIDIAIEALSAEPKCYINGTPFSECGWCEHFNCDTNKCEADSDLISRADAIKTVISWLPKEHHLMLKGTLALEDIVNALDSVPSVSVEKLQPRVETSDFISRADAITGLCDYVDYKCEHHGGEFLYTDEFCKVIKNLPSVSANSAEISKHDRDIIIEELAKRKAE